MSSIRNIWVLGGTGFIGKALVNWLSQYPTNKLHLLIHRNIQFNAVEHCNVFTGDLSDFDFKWFDRYPPDVIFHLARFAGSKDFLRTLVSVKSFLANNRLLNYVSSLQKKPVIVYVSGSLMYGPQLPGRLADERSKLTPVSYARYYFRGERPFIDAQIAQSADIRFARPGWIIGAGSWFKTFYWQPYLSSGKVPQYGDGNQLMSLIEVGDCARQIADLAFNGKTNMNLNILNGQPVSQKEFSGTLARLLNTTMLSVTLKQMQRQYGKTAADALNASIPLKTIYPETINIQRQEYTDIEAMLAHTLSLFKNN